LNFKWHNSPTRSGSLFCIKQINIYCLTYRITKLTTLLLKDKGISPKMIFNTLKPTLSEVFLYTWRLNSLHNVWILSHEVKMCYCLYFFFTKSTFVTSFDIYFFFR
jgi:hypothetical protein